MTTPDVDDALAERIGALLDAHPNMSDTRAAAWAQTLAVPCRWCGVEAGHPCLRSDGRPLDRFLGHVHRVKAAGVHLGDTDERDRTWCGHRTPADGCAHCRPVRDRTGDAWPEVPPPSSPAEDDQGWRRG